MKILNILTNILIVLIKQHFVLHFIKLFFISLFLRDDDSAVELFISSSTGIFKIGLFVKFKVIIKICLLLRCGFQT